MMETFRPFYIQFDKIIIADWKIEVKCEKCNIAILKLHNKKRLPLKPQFLRPGRRICFLS